MKTIFITFLLLIAITINSQTERLDALKFNDTEEKTDFDTSYDLIPLMRNSGRMNGSFIHADSLVLHQDINQIIASLGEYLPISGGTVTGLLKLEDKLLIGNISDIYNNANIFETRSYTIPDSEESSSTVYDLEINGPLTGTTNYQGYKTSLIDNTSGENTLGELTGYQSKTETQGTANKKLQMGIDINNVHTGSGNVDWLWAARLKSEITGTNSSTVNGVMRAIAPYAILDNANASVQFLQSTHPNVTLNAGEVTDDIAVIYVDLDLDVASDNIEVGGNITYIEAGEDNLSTFNEVGGEKRFIWYKGFEKSDFGGFINSLKPLEDYALATEDVLVPKKYVSQELANYEPTTSFNSTANYVPYFNGTQYVDSHITVSPHSSGNNRFTLENARNLVIDKSSSNLSGDNGVYFFIDGQQSFSVGTSDSSVPAGDLNQEAVLYHHTNGNIKMYSQINSNALTVKTSEANGGIATNSISLNSLNTAPISSTDIGAVGELRFTTTGIFICVATNMWIKTQVDTTF